MRGDAAADAPASAAPELLIWLVILFTGLAGGVAQIRLIRTHPLAHAEEKAVYWPQSTGLTCDRPQ